MKYIYLLLVLFITRGLIFSQNGPANVSSNIQLWLKSDALSSSPISSWIDNSGTGNTVTQNTISQRPIWGSNFINYNPTVTFDGTTNLSGTELFSSASIKNNIEYFIVFKKSVSTGGYLINEDYGGANVFRVWMSDFADFYFNVPILRYDNLNSTPTLLDYNSSAIGTSSRNIIKDGLVVSTDNNGGTITPTSGAQFFVGSDIASSGVNFTGDVAEMILYESNLPNTDRKKVSSYLALKYGITLAHNYTNSSGSLIYDTTGYTEKIIGIGRDDNGSLLQKQSHTLDDTVKIYLSTLETTNTANTGSFTNNLSFAVVGCNKGKMNATPTSNTELPGGCNLFSRIEREWKLTKTNLNQNFNMDFKLSSSAAPGNVDISNLRLLVDDDGDFSNGGTSCYFNGDGSGIVISYSNPVITISNIGNTHIPNNSTKFITISSNNSFTPLPIELIYFSATRMNNKSVGLDWKTASETNNDYYSVERSKNGLDWELLKNIDGTGNSSSPLKYNFIDEEPYPGVSYYRLKQTDFNGQFEYSEIKNVNMERFDNSEIVIYPNPINNQVTVIANANELNELAIYDTFGKNATLLARKIEKHNNKLILDVSNLSSGIYYIKTKTSTHKVNKL
ncbi:MAG: T9SS type A sorting domain-containing protein [Lishizhenia sp.]